jgi:hypothetical protein
VTDDESARLKAARAHICLRCKRPCERASVKKQARGWAVDVACHGDVQSSLVTPAELEDGTTRWYWFTASEYDLPVQRHELHIYIHNKDEQ